MGTASDPALRGVAARALFSELERQARESITAHGEIDVNALADTLETHLDNLRNREALLRFIAAYLARCLASDAVPDYRLWTPPG